MDDAILDNIQIEELAQKMNVPLAMCGFKDQLPRQLEYNKTYIVNMEDQYNAEGEPNTGSHWVAFQVNKYPNDLVKGIYFDSYGMPPPELVKSRIKKSFGIAIPHSTKDIQSMMSNVCGWFCLAWGHFINAYQGRHKDIHQDTEMFLELFQDLNKSVDWKHNEFFLRQFFRSPNSTRNEADFIRKDAKIPEGHKALGLTADIKFV